MTSSRCLRRQLYLEMGLRFLFVLGFESLEDLTHVVDHEETDQNNNDALRDGQRDDLSKYSAYYLDREMGHQKSVVNAVKPFHH